MKKKSLLSNNLIQTKYYGQRPDGTSKGSGYLGEIPMTDGSDAVMTELSFDMDIDGKKVLMPAIVPTLTKDEIKYLTDGKDPFKNKSIMDKAVSHGMKRIREGKSPFANDGPEHEFKKQKGFMQ